MMNAKEKAEKLLSGMSTIFLATNGEEGYPDVRALSALKSEGLKTVWMLTGEVEGEHKVAELRRNPKCMIYSTAMEDDQDYIELRLFGTVEILTDEASRSAVWRDDYLRYFPEGKDSPLIRILKFTASSGQIQTIKDLETLDF